MLVLTFREQIILAKDQSIDLQKAAFVSLLLEHQLFIASSSFEAYADMNTFNKRLEQVVSLNISKINEHGKWNKDFVKARHQLLRKKVGKKLYNDIVMLVNEIKIIRKTNMTWTKVIPKIKNEVVEGVDRTAKHLLPPELYAIYFGCRLMTAEAQISVKSISIRSETVEFYDWEELVKEAKKNVAAFRKIESNAETHGLSGFGCCPECV